MTTPVELAQDLVARGFDLTSIEQKTLIEEIGYNPARKLTKAGVRVGRGVYNCSPEVLLGAATATPAPVKTKAPAPAMAARPSPKTEVVTMNDTSSDRVEFETSFVPEKDPTYVRWGHYKDVETIVKSGMFFPVFISGLSGNGKTFMIEQVCANLKREYVRVQINPSTDEDDLIGGYKLLKGETVFEDGPVIKAMRRGAVLCIDEIDRGTNKIMCLQGVMEGKPVLIKKTGEVVHPAPGFTVLATANTKGRGSDDGRFSAATMIDDAFLERFAVTIDQTFPSLAQERKILVNHLEKFGSQISEAEIELLVKWVQAIRKTYEDGGIEEVISTRRLCHIVQTYSIMNDLKKSVSLCIARFDDDVRDSMMSLYDKLEGEAPTHDTTQSFDPQTPF
jgi:hypothetical protein